MHFRLTILFFSFSFTETESHSVVQAGGQWYNHSLLQPQSPVLKRSFCLSLPSWTTGMHCHAQFIFFSFVETESLYVAQADLKLLPSLPSEVLGFQE